MLLIMTPKVVYAVENINLSRRVVICRQMDVLFLAHMDFVFEKIKLGKRNRPRGILSASYGIFPSPFQLHPREVEWQMVSR